MTLSTDWLPATGVEWSTDPAVLAGRRLDRSGWEPEGTVGELRVPGAELLGEAQLAAAAVVFPRSPTTSRRCCGAHSPAVRPWSRAAPGPR